MCGIVGYVGAQPSVPFLLDGLKNLEYRGYDSAGMALNDNGCIDVFRASGKLCNLYDKLSEVKQKISVSRIGIGHIRWATHGGATIDNAHPHKSNDGRLVLVHNGIIENYEALKLSLQKKGYNFFSQTDTEAAVHLIDDEYKQSGSLETAVVRAVNRLKGAFAFCIMHENEADKIIAVRKNAPLIIGLGEGENFIASDVPAIIGKAKQMIYLDDNELAIVRRDGVSVKNFDGSVVLKKVENLTWEPEAISKRGFKHFMLKEIHEQPTAIKTTITPRINEGMVDFSECGLTDEVLAGYDNIFVVACGTAMYAGMVGKYIIEKVARTRVTVDMASEFRYRDPIIGKKDLVILISQSGETADTREAMNIAKAKGATTLALVNVKGSSIAREADLVMYTHAGPEISVASTKAFTVQVSMMYLFAYKLAYAKKIIDKETYMNYIKELVAIPDVMEKFLADKDECQYAASKIMNADSLLYIGRGLDYALSMEGALKLKEISYIHSEAYAAGELKHGPIALISDQTPVVAIATQSSLYEKTVSNIQECKARGAKVVLMCGENAKVDEKTADIIIRIPEVSELVMPVLAAVPLQLIAYYTAVLKGNDVDKPRNLAKSVTVE